MASFLQGRRFGVLGDSISAAFENAWQNVVITRTGMVLQLQDARLGRQWSQAFECFGAPALGGQPGNFTASAPVPVTGQSCGSITTGITDGESFSATLANVDLEVIELGTNDSQVPVGSLGDSQTAATFYGNMRWVVETYLNAKPSLRIVFVTPQMNGYSSASVTQQYVAAEVAYGNSMGIPVINMFKLGGVNPLSSGTLTRDGTHESDYGFTNYYGPVIAQGLQQVF